MREILFRGKRKKDGEWVEGNLFIPNKPDTPTQICMGTHTIRICYEIIPETVGQYTGLTDKNGKKIFEGDILKYVSKNSGANRIYGVVVANEWNCSCCGGVFGFSLDGKGDLRDYKLYEVAGNIHDNPELLK